MSTSAPEAPSAPVETPETSDDGGLLEALNDMFESSGDPSAPDNLRIAGGDDAPKETPGDETPGDETPKKDPLDSAPSGDEEEGKEADDDGLPDFEESKDWTPGVARRIKQMKLELRRARAEAEEVRLAEEAARRELAELKGSGNDYEALAAKLKEYEDQRALENLESTEAFQEAVTRPLERLMGQAREISDRYDIDHDDLVDALAMDDEDAQEAKLSDLLALASDRDKARIYRIVEDLNPIFERRAELYSNVEEALNEAKLLEETREQAKAAERARERSNAARVVAARLSEKIPFLREIEGVDLDRATEEAAGNDPAELGMVDYAYTALAGKLLPAVVKDYSRLRKELDTLVDKLAAYEQADPGSRPAGTDSPHVPVDDEDLPLGEALNRRLAGL